MLQVKPFYRNILLLIIATCTSVASSTALHADINNEQSNARGLEISSKRKLANSGWQSSRSLYEMTLFKPNGSKSTREMSIDEIEVNDDGNKSLTVFQMPADVKGTAFLNHSHLLEPDDQWLYLPKLKRTKRISSKSKSGPFMGSEFAYEDLSSFELEKYQHNYLNEEKIDGIGTYVVELLPLYPNSGYSKIISWVAKDNFRLVQAQYYDRKKSLLKTLKAEDYRLLHDKFWRAYRMTMTNHVTGKYTTLDASSITLNAGLNQQQFSKQKISRRQ
ncbi:outer membrane lipoprotein-sorting protein [Agaribacterium haliotis]|uniref:outer membrane lipoprotein-sorting protein n=1 Tax=Agaribacterium haliotis TaxID=2013869 RepID=UPI000BB54D99|nr:outer membrane lipoprotein-sorting protein [Agaribacterium haliotis]